MPTTKTPKSQTLAVLDPNNASGWMEVHKAGCAHLTRSVRGIKRGEGAWTLTASSLDEAAAEIASDFINEGSMTVESAMADIEWAPCVKLARSEPAPIDWSKEPKGLGEGAVDFDPKTGTVTPIDEAPSAPKRRRKAKDSDLVYVEGVGTVLPVEAPAKPKRAAKSTAKQLVAVKAIAPSAADRLGDVAGKGTLADYVVRWPKTGADLLQRVAGDGPAWQVRCNAHGTLTSAENVKAADVAGRKAQRVTWCAKCAAS